MIAPLVENAPTFALESSLGMGDIPDKEWAIEFHPEFEKWLDEVDSEELVDEILAAIGLLKRGGPMLGRPTVDHIEKSRHANMKELRICYRNQPWRCLFAFDPNQRAVLLVGGNKTTDKKWYVRNIAIADRRYDDHLAAIKQAARSARGGSERTKGRKR